MEGGLADNVKDMIILTAGSQAFSLLSNWLWLLLLLAPLRAFYMLWTSVIAPWIFQPGEEEDEVSDKKKKKQERQMKRQMRCKGSLTFLSRKPGKLQTYLFTLKLCNVLHHLYQCKMQIIATQHCVCSKPELQMPLL